MTAAVPAVRVKICGITRLADARAAVDAGASAIGLVFWPGSPRCVTLGRAAEIAAAIDESVTTVGVFVDQPRDDVERAVRVARLRGIQLHGREDVREYAFGLPVLKAIGVGAWWNAAVLTTLPASVLPLLDARDEERKGGTGRMIDWQIAAAAATVRPIALAGGLTPANVQDALRIVQPYAIDVSSGVESAPGIKDEARIRLFLDAVRSVAEAVPRGLF